MIAACCVTLAVLLAVGDSRPHHQQLYYPVPGAQSSFYYVPQADAASVTSVQRYAAQLPVALPPQYVLLYPGGPQHNFIHHRADEATTNRPTIWNLFNIFQRPTSPPTVEEVESDADKVTTPTSQKDTTQTAAPPRTVAPVTTTTAATTVEETTPKAGSDAPAKPEKIVGEGDKTMTGQQEGDGPTDEEKASLENLDEGLPPNPQSEESDGSPTDRRQYTLVQRPQFFGNYDLLHQGDMQQRFGVPPGAISNFLLFRNGFVKPALVPSQGRPQKMEEGNEVPGAAALAFQQALRDASSGGVPVPPLVYLAPGLGGPAFQANPAPPGFLQVVPSAQYPLIRGGTAPAVVVEADRPRKDDSEDVEAAQAGPSVAQAKPQAIALAGVGGMAAAAPVATAVVGPGGLAVAAPTATAVAGPSGGGSLVGPVQAAIAAANKHVSKGGAGKARNSEYRQDARHQ